MARLHLTLVYCKGQGQCHVLSTVNNLEMAIEENVTITIKNVNHVLTFDWPEYSNFVLTNFKGQGYAYFNSETGER